MHCGTPSRRCFTTICLRLIDWFSAMRRLLRQKQRAFAATWRNLFLWVESNRLQHDFKTAREYAEYPVRLFPEFSAIKNFALHARDRLQRGTPTRGWFDYPRAALQRALAL